MKPICQERSALSAGPQIVVLARVYEDDRDVAGSDAFERVQVREVTRHEILEYSDLFQST